MLTIEKDVNKEGEEDNDKGYIHQEYYLTKGSNSIKEVISPGNTHFSP